MANAQTTLKNAIRAGKSCLVTNETIHLYTYMNTLFDSAGIGVCWHIAWGFYGATVRLLTQFITIA